jgi:hypothetical protein
MRKTLLSAIAILFVPAIVPAQTPHLPRGTATDVSSDDVQATLKKTPTAAVSDQAIRVVRINDEYNVGIGWCIAPRPREGAREAPSSTARSPRFIT